MVLGMRQPVLVIGLWISRTLFIPRWIDSLLAPLAKRGSAGGSHGTDSTESRAVAGVATARRRKP
jgi:hypothetical protein